jgi:enterochelin esterase family protein
MRFLILAGLAATLQAAEPRSVRELMELSRGDAAAFRHALLASLGEGEIRKGTALLGEGADFLFAVESARPPVLHVDDQPVGLMVRLEGAGNLWYKLAKLQTGTAHTFHYMAGGERLGGRNDVPAFGPDSFEQPGVPRGRLSEKRVHTSAIYDGLQSDYWIYVPAQYDAAAPAAVMVWQDGQNLAAREGRTRALIVFDNLTHQEKIPVIIQVFVSPGRLAGKAMRSVEYDTVNDRYTRFLRDEILAEVGTKYNLRRDGYSRAIAGSSSGGICAFNAAWQHPDEFSRVLSWIGSFTSIQWHPGRIDGGNVYPFKIRKEPKRNIRVWLQDGAEDLENSHGSWPLQNIQMANSLKMRDYDFHFSFGGGTHNSAHGAAELPESLAWLWRDYDPARTSQVYEMEPAERAKPLFRVRVYNR